jgi:hypothetical protein
MASFGKKISTKNTKIFAKEKGASKFLKILQRVANSRRDFAALFPGCFASVTLN